VFLINFQDCSGPVHYGEKFPAKLLVKGFAGIQTSQRSFLWGKLQLNSSWEPKLMPNIFNTHYI
jgi:hypothetical protein